MKKDFLNRYTSLPVLLDLLSKNKITLLSPETWEDRNDSFFIEEYKRKSKLKSVLALCFSTKRETFHHWKVFASRSSGVCIEFDRAHLLASIEESLNSTQSNRRGVFRSRDVDYKWIYELEQNKSIVDDWPFIKRKVFADEGEFRIIYQNMYESESVKSVAFDLNAVRKVTLSPWMPKPVAETIKRIVQGIPYCAHIKVSHSTLIENLRWQDSIKKPYKRV